MNNLFLIFGLGGSEMFLIFGAMILLFGGKKIPELMRGIGKGVKEFNDARANVETELKAGMRDAENSKRMEQNSKES